MDARLQPTITHDRTMVRSSNETLIAHSMRHLFRRLTIILNEAIEFQGRERDGDARDEERATASGGTR